jgi:hypothetical protein
MDDIANMEHCGKQRDLNAFIFRDWWALRARFDFDVRELREGIPRKLAPPPEKPFLRAKVIGPRANRPASPMSEPSPTVSKGRSSPPLATGPEPQSEDRTERPEKPLT